MLLPLALALLAQAPRCELAPTRTEATAEQPLRFSDGTVYGSIGPMGCAGDSAYVTASGTIDEHGRVSATFTTRGFTLFTYGELQLYTAQKGPLQVTRVEQGRAFVRPPMRADTRSEPVACADLRLLPPTGGSRDPHLLAVICDRMDLGELTLACLQPVDLYVKNGEKLAHQRSDRLERVGSIAAGTPFVHVADVAGWTVVSPYNPVPFSLGDDWTWWVRTSALKGCSHPD